MSAKKRLIKRILTSDDPKLIAKLMEVIEMIRQGKSDEEIKAYFGITE